MVKRTERRPAREVVKRLTSWSISRLLLWEKCPYAAKLKHIVKETEASSYSSDRGDTIHKRGEQYLLGNIRGVPAGFEKFAKDLRSFKSHDAKPELDLAVTVAWRPTTWNDWNGAWCRGRGDAVIPPGDDPVVNVVDYKTGKVYDHHADQLELMALLCFSHFPTAKLAIGELWYLDSGQLDRREVPKRSVGKLRDKWTARVEPMLRDTKFKATPSADACRFCGFHQQRGGSCPYGK